MNDKKYTKEQINWLKKYCDAEFKAVREAVGKAEDKYLADSEKNNEFRGQLKDQAGRFVTRQELWSAAIAMAAIVIGIMQLIK